MADNIEEEGMEIVLDAGPDADDINRSPNQINYEYVQNTVKGIKRVFTLFDDVYLNYSLENSNPVAFKLKFFRDKDTVRKGINLTYMGLDPERLGYIAWNWLYAGLAALALAFILVYVGEYSNFSFAHEAMLPAGILLSGFGLIAFMIFYYKTQDKIIYKSCIGQAPVFELFHMPRKMAYNDFLDVLDQSIFKAHHKKGMTMKYRLVGELKYLRRLNEAGSISNADYEAARSKIFRHKEYQV